MRVLSGEKTVTGGDLSADFKSSPISYEHMWVGSVQIRWSGSPVGDFHFQISNVGDPNDDTVWIDVDNTTIAAGGGPGKHIWNYVESIGSKYIRVIYVSTSGTGSLDLWAEGKGV